ncbi:MAG: diacylglycerol kinase [Aureliella sp.]
MRSHWYNKFANAVSGVRLGIVGQSSFHVHLTLSFATLGMAYALDCEAWQWCVLGLCIGLVLSLELMNSALEVLAKGVCTEHNELVGQALDIASGAVLVASCVSAAIGFAIFLMQLS